MVLLYIHKRKDNGEIYYVGISTNLKRPYSIHSRSKEWRETHNISGTKCTTFKLNNLLEATLAEKYLIKKKGNIYDGTGLLVNKTKGGETPFKINYKFHPKSEEVKIIIFLSRAIENLPNLNTTPI